MQIEKLGKRKDQQQKLRQQFQQTMDISIGFSRTGLQKKFFNENFWRSDNRGSDNRGCTV